ncbi:hypothetical protein [Delftia acidovorans]|uniref:Uncharacterized protein n=1 Tax=Delftia acidovorans TaxID=80866 RepID=A0AAJ2R9V5_DELAC|nr:hypothetical protein [Delftia acidovorans]MDX4957888.1 hypothetical protein [Delftia acidovorans]
MKPTAFHIPGKSVMAGAKHQRPVNHTAGQYIRVVGQAVSRAESDRRHAMRKASI